MAVHYRYDTHGYDEYSEQFFCDEFAVIKVTQAGQWLQVYGKKKFVLNTSRKKFAYPTRELALESFIARKTRQIGILKAQTIRAETALKAAQSYEINPKPLLIEYAYPTD